MGDLIIAFVGSGGKTTTIHEYRDYFLKENKKVFVTTSTHMKIENDTILGDNAIDIIKELNENGYVMAGQLSEDGKIKALSIETYNTVCEVADVVLVEADGSKGFPIKYPNENEPVIYENVDEIIVVCGLNAIGKKAKEVCHRISSLPKKLAIEKDTIIKAEHVELLLKEGYLKPLQRKYPNKIIKIFPRQGDSLYLKAVAKLLEDKKDVSIIKEEWFNFQQKLIICGCGHISVEIAKIATHLNYPIKVIDDREEFANQDRFPKVKEVICDSFSNIEKHLEDYANYVVVTRGHKDDYQCVKSILSHKYTYLGMIGSRKKVYETFEKLKLEGFTEEQISTIHAPIGLPIGAETPTEIAISILAEIIQEKNKKIKSYISRDLATTDKDGVLCIIIDKRGSTPRGIGSMMFVTENGIIDTIGGGAVEYAVIQEAKKCNQVMIKTYELNNNQSSNLGMICGGSNDILFLPIKTYKVN